MEGRRGSQGRPGNWKTDVVQRLSTQNCKSGTSLWQGPRGLTPRGRPEALRAHKSIPCHARTTTDLRELQHGVAAEFHRRDDLHVRMHLLPFLRPRYTGQCLSELRRRLQFAAHPAPTQLERRRLPRRASCQPNRSTPARRSTPSPTIRRGNQINPAGSAMSGIVDPGVQRPWPALANAAEELKVSPGFVRQLLEGGILPVERIVRNAPGVFGLANLQLPAAQAHVTPALSIHRGRCPGPTSRQCRSGPRHRRG